MGKLRYQVELDFRDGKNNPPPVEVEGLFALDKLDDAIYDALVNDYGDPIGVGATVTITRLA